VALRSETSVARVSSHALGGELAAVGRRAGCGRVSVMTSTGTSARSASGHKASP